MKGGVDGIGEEEGRHIKDEEDGEYRMFIDEDADIDESSEPQLDETSSRREKSVSLVALILSSKSYLVYFLDIKKFFFFFIFLRNKSCYNQIYEFMRFNNL